MKDFKKNDICKTCKGRCCKNMGCNLSPDDIEGDVSYDSLKNLLNTGLYSIDWWESYQTKNNEITNGYFIRARNKNSNIVDPSWGGECVMLTGTGCPLSFEKRPKGGRYLVAANNINDDCIEYYDKKECADDWFKYYEILYKLVDELYK